MDPALKLLIDRWDSLPEAIRKAITAMVETVK